MGIVLKVLLALLLAFSSAESGVEENYDTQGAEKFSYEEAESGFYVVSSVGEDGDVSFYYSLTAENGYIDLEKDGTGVMCLEDEEQELTWDESYLYCDEETIPYLYLSAEESMDGEAMLMIFFEEGKISIILRPVEDPELESV